MKRECDRSFSSMTDVLLSNTLLTNIPATIWPSLGSSVSSKPMQTGCHKFALDAILSDEQYPTKNFTLPVH